MEVSSLENAATFGVLESSTFELALVRTELSNSSTLLAHTQAFVGLLISAIAVSKYLGSSWVFDLCGILFVILAFAVLARGAFLFRKTSRLIESKKSLSEIT
jgi:membrane protein CcdC involved in cytochrome C biogenesis